MSLNETASAERLHIGFFGLRNAGKSSVVNAVTGQKLSLVSEIRGTTTDPVKKAMELLPLGPVVIIDTPGIDDSGELGKMRVERALQTLDKTDIAVLVVDALKGMQPEDEQLCDAFRKGNIPYITAYNKSDLLEQIPDESRTATGENPGKDDGGQAAPSVPAGEKGKDNVIYVSALTGSNIYELKEMIGRIAGRKKNEKKLIGDLISEKDLVILVTPIDESAPKGRMILPQQQMIRDVLDHHAINIVVQVEELADTLKMLKKKPAMVITDSQAFGQVSRIVPEDIPLTSFSILFARYKGELEVYVRGAASLAFLKDGDRVLISEGCTHHRQCNDIGTVKMPGWISGYCGKQLEFSFTSGGEFPRDLSPYALVVHCGGCMLNEKEMHSRTIRAEEARVPMTNYGTAIAQIHGILKRSLSPFPDISKCLD